MAAVAAALVVQGTRVRILACRSAKRSPHTFRYKYRRQEMEDKSEPLPMNQRVLSLKIMIDGAN